MQKRDGGQFSGVSIIFEIVPHSARLAVEKASFLKIKDINDISFFGTPYCHHCCSIA
jgi:hypothetical protein